MEGVSMKKYFIPVLLILSVMTVTSLAQAIENPDVEGWIVKIDTTKGVLRILSAMPENGRLQHDYKVEVEPGKIDQFRMNDYVQVKYREDKLRAGKVEKASPNIPTQNQRA